jgi:hypothetical protein
MTTENIMTVSEFVKKLSIKMMRMRIKTTIDKRIDGKEIDFGIIHMLKKVLMRTKRRDEFSQDEMNYILNLRTSRKNYDANNSENQAVEEVTSGETNVD